MREYCKEIADMLVDYADGQLSAEESTRVTAHLAECDDCRTLLNGLHKSLELAQVIWEDNLSQAETIRIPAPARTSRRSWPRYAAAAAILIASGISITSLIMNKPAKNQTTFAEIERKITEAGNADRLLAAADRLSEYPDAQPVAKRQYRYILDRYPDTSAAAEAKLRI